MSNFMKKLSVVIPVYNVEKYLEQCINSICGQSYQNLEIILINDGSEDGSLNICEDAARKDPRITVISQINGGLSAARNTGMAHASGEYITFVDSDDYVDTEMFSDMITEMEGTDADISVCNFEKFWGNKTKNNIVSSNESEALTAAETLGKLYTDQQVIFVTAWGKIYKRELFDGVTYPVGRINEDIFTTYKTYAKADKVIYMNRAYYKYRQRAGSIIHTKFSLKNLDSLDGLREMKDFVLTIDGFTVQNNVIGEYIEKIIYFYFKLDELSNVNTIKKALHNEARQLIRTYCNSIRLKEKIKFAIFIYCPIAVRILVYVTRRRKH